MNSPWPQPGSRTNAPEAGRRFKKRRSTIRSTVSLGVGKNPFTHPLRLHRLGQLHLCSPTMWCATRSQETNPQRLSLVEPLRPIGQEAFTNFAAVDSFLEP